MKYKSKYTGKQVDELLEKAGIAESKVDELATAYKEALEAYVSLSRDFSDDFNNDFAR